MSYQITVSVSDLKQAQEILARLGNTAPAEITDKKEKKTTTKKEAEVETAPATAAQAVEAEQFDLGFEETKATVKEKKTKALSLTEVIETFKGFAARTSRDDAAAVLAKFGTKSVRDIKEADYPALMKMLTA